MKNKTIHLQQQQWSSSRYPFDWYIYKESRSWHRFLFESHIKTERVYFMPLCTYQAIKRNEQNTVHHNRWFSIYSVIEPKIKQIIPPNNVGHSVLEWGMIKHNKYVRAFMSNGTCILADLILNHHQHSCTTLSSALELNDIQSMYAKSIISLQ